MVVQVQRVLPQSRLRSRSVHAVHDLPGDRHSGILQLISPKWLIQFLLWNYLEKNLLIMDSLLGESSLCKLENTTKFILS